MAPSPVSIRPATPDDLARVAAQYAHEDTPWDPFGDVDRLRRIPLEGFLIATVEGEYAGFLYWFESRRPYFRPGLDRAASLHELHVLEPFRRRGVGRSLVERFVEDARSRGLRTLFVDTDDDNRTARTLYESVGFRRYRDVHHFELRL